jgi:AraC-like DNA-binding protein
MSKSRHDTILVRGVALGYSDGFVLERHRHDWTQLVFASSGVMVVTTDDGSWVVPPQRAVLVPPYVDHEIAMRGEVSMRTLYFREIAPPGVVVIGVTPLLRELVIHCVARMALDHAVAADQRLIGLLLDLVAQAEPMPLGLPMPQDLRAFEVAQGLLRDPANPKYVGASVRTLERLFLAETGMTLGRWRQQARLHHALAALAAGHSVNEVAEQVGYASPSAFIAMFKAALGTSPAKFL